MAFPGPAAMITIPESVLAAIQRERPGVAARIEDLRRNPSMARYLERDIANAYLSSPTSIQSDIAQSLEACRRGERYGGGVR